MEDSDLEMGVVHGRYEHNASTDVPAGGIRSGNIVLAPLICVARDFEQQLPFLAGVHMRALNVFSEISTFDDYGHLVGPICACVDDAYRTTVCLPADRPLNEVALCSLRGLEFDDHLRALTQLVRIVRDAVRAFGFGDGFGRVSVSFARQLVGLLGSQVRVHSDTDSEESCK